MLVISTSRPIVDVVKVLRGGNTAIYHISRIINSISTSVQLPATSSTIIHLQVISTTSVYYNKCQTKIVSTHPWNAYQSSSIIHANANSNTCSSTVCTYYLHLSNTNASILRDTTSWMYQQPYINIIFMYIIAYGLPRCHDFAEHHIILRGIDTSTAIYCVCSTLPMLYRTSVLDLLLVSKVSTKFYTTPFHSQVSSSMMDQHQNCSRFGALGNAELSCHLFELRYIIVISSSSNRTCPRESCTTR